MIRSADPLATVRALAESPRWPVRFGIAATLLAVAFVLVPYLVNRSFVGRFPAESPMVGEHAAYSQIVTCFHPDDPARTVDFLTPRPDPTFESPDAYPSLGLASPLTLGVEDTIQNSPSLYYSFFRNRLYPFDTPAPTDGIVEILRTSGDVSAAAYDRYRRELTTVIAPPCRVPVHDRGVTEAYWSTKGTSVLHHWSFLYDAAVHDGKPVHAQYGFLVSTAARAMAVRAGMSGPTGFVRFAWALYAAIAVVYVLVFLYLFRERPGIALLGIMTKIAVFLWLGGFAILLAPGFHWARDLTLLAPVGMLPLAFRAAATRSARLWALVVALTAFFAVLDVSFVIIAAASVVAALAVRHLAEIRAFVVRRRFQTVVIAAVVAALVAALAFVDRSNIGYALLKVSGVANFAVEPRFESPIYWNVLLACVVLLCCSGRKLDSRAGYVAFASLASLLFYLVTADEFHFKKYLEYCVPLYTLVAIVVVDALATRFRPPLYALRAIDAVAIVGACVIMGTSIGGFVAPHPYWELHLHDEYGDPYFTSAAHTVNGRTFQADLNDDAVARLDAFPNAARFDVLLSPLDKYVLFLYDRHNGFASPDETTNLIVPHDVDAAAARIVDGHLTAIVDRDAMKVNFSMVIDVSHPILGGSEAASSELYLKESLRLAELESYLVRKCPTAPVGSGGHWLVVHC